MGGDKTLVPTKIIDINKNPASTKFSRQEKPRVDKNPVLTKIPR
jgi:hypothetical protein